ncbi:enoyl-CoA hydratase/isomerase family protein [Pseudoalteromonas piscicida]|uniref:enoyl-CoA hydratase/isomerase family protein n=1 Tax=Pseudoalteromonas piscicida TaxID=43662 RepID=UPI0032C14B53
MEPTQDKIQSAENIEFSGDLEADLVLLNQQLKYEHDLISGHSEVVISDLTSWFNLRRGFLRQHSRVLYWQATAQGQHAHTGQALLAHIAKVAPQFVCFYACQRAELTEKWQRGLQDQSIGLLLSFFFADETCGEHLIRSYLRCQPGSVAYLREFTQTGILNLPKVTVEKQGNIGHITFNNPQCLNAEDNQLVADLNIAVDLVYLSEDIEAGVLRGGVTQHAKYQGKRIFSAGVNLKQLHKSDISFVDFMIGRELGYVNKMIHGVLSEDGGKIVKPWISVVDTFAIGGGMQLLLASDYVIAEEGSYASLPAGNEGIIPGLANMRLAKKSCARVAKEVILLGRKLWAGEPDCWGVFDQVVRREDLQARLEEMAQLLSTPAVRENKRMLITGSEPIDELRRYLAEFCLVQGERIYSKDVANKVSKFTLS